VSDNSSIQDLDNVTICALINAEGWGESNAGRIISKSTNNSNAGGWQVLVTSGKAIQVIHGYSTSQGLWTTPSNPLDLGEWFRVVVTFNRSDISNTIKVYVNGESQSITESTSPVGTVSSDVGDDIKIGSRGTDREFDGIIKDVEIYNEAKDASWVSQDYAKRVPDSDLLYWIKDSVKDKSRYNRSGTVVSVIEGNKLEFNGTDSVISTGSDFIATSDFSLMGWINPDSFGENNEGRILDNGRAIVYLDSTTNRLRATSDGGVNIARSDNAITTGQWQHIAVTRSGTVFTMYVNGVDVTTSGLGGIVAAGTTVLFVGNNQAGSRTFDGKIDDLKVYGRVLTAADILNNYNATRGQY
jgi:hypothetical protein